MGSLEKITLDVRGPENARFTLKPLAPETFAAAVGALQRFAEKTYAEKLRAECAITDKRPLSVYLLNDVSGSSIRVVSSTGEQQDPGFLPVFYSDDVLRKKGFSCV
ncbi:MAG: hypothetical protein Q8N98_05380, partial [bacterium]|nr:hypothetical protein [bacterium]